jgi:hypothetical protein
MCFCYETYNCFRSDNDIPLHLSAFIGNLDVCKVLVEVDPASVNDAECKE